jgi:YD repeat-containing protein
MKNKSLILTSLLIFLLVLAFPAYAAVYTYDGLNRLKSVTYENGLQITYNYDAAGNVLSVSSTGIGNNNPEVGGITITPDLVPVNTSVSAYVYYTRNLRLKNLRRFFAKFIYISHKIHEESVNLHSNYTIFFTAF